MPRTTLGRITTNYSTRDDTFILSAILPTSCSYEYPVLIRTKKELDSYMGDNFPYRGYYIYLLNNNITLFFYRPISNDIPNDEYGVPLIEESTSWNNRDTVRIWNKDYMWEKKENSDTVIRFSNDHCHPSYRKTHSDRTIPSGGIDPSNPDYDKYPYTYESLGGGIANIDSDLFDTDKQSLAFVLDFSKVTFDDFFPEEGTENYRYIIISNGRYNRQFWFNSGTSHTPPIGTDVVTTRAIEIPIQKSASAEEDLQRRRDCIDEVIRIISADFSLGLNPGLGYEVIPMGDDVYKIYSTNSPEDNLGFFNLPNLKFYEDFRLSNDLVSAGTENVKQIEFYSRTTGKASQDITVTISRMSYDDKYIIEVKRYDYQEYFEVKLDETPDMYGNVIPIADTINRQSKLITCKYFGTQIQQLDYNNDPMFDDQGKPIMITPPLPEGTYSLRGAVEESYGVENFRRSLELMKDTTVLEDFFLVDNLLRWRSDENPIASKDDIKYIYDYTYEKNCQGLISTRTFLNNLDEHDKKTFHEFENAYFDKEGGMYSNRLVYFYGDLFIDFVPVPQYYVFLKGILTDKYSVDETDVIQLMDTSDEFLKLLDEYSVNYLSYNNMEYYYNKLDGKLSVSTILMRYCVSRVSRTFINRKWKLLGVRTSEREQNLSDIISYLKSSISLISSITVDSKETQNHNLTLRISMIVRGLVQNNISLDITLNYNS